MVTTSRMEWAEQCWANLEPGLLAKIRESGATEEAAEWVVGDLKPRLFELMVSSPHAPKHFSEEMQVEVNDILYRCSLASLIQLVRIELELYAWRFDKRILTSEAQAAHATFVLPDSAEGSQPN